MYNKYKTLTGGRNEKRNYIKLLAQLERFMLGKRYRLYIEEEAVTTAMLITKMWSIIIVISIKLLENMASVPLNGR